MSRPRSAYDLAAIPGASRCLHWLAHRIPMPIREVNQQKQAEMKGFLGWLEEYSGARVEDMTNKTKLRVYYELEFSELLAILKKNRRKLGADPTSRQFMGDSAPGVRRLDGLPAAPSGADQEDRSADSTGSTALLTTISPWWTRPRSEGRGT